MFVSWSILYAHWRQHYHLKKKKKLSLIGLHYGCKPTALFNLDGSDLITIILYKSKPQLIDPIVGYSIT